MAKQINNYLVTKFQKIAINYKKKRLLNKPIELVYSEKIGVNRALPFYPNHPLIKDLETLYNLERIYQ